MATQLCEVVRRQQPPYHWNTSDHHEWSQWGYCKHCGRERWQVKCKENERRKKIEPRIGPEFAPRPLPHSTWIYVNGTLKAIA